MRETRDRESGQRTRKNREPGGGSRGVALWLALAIGLAAVPSMAAPPERCNRLFPDFTCDDREARPPGHVAPMSMPFLFEDPYITTELNLVGIYHNFPSDSVFGGGEAGVIALQARLAITDRLAFIATKDGVMFLRPDNPLLNDQDGAFDITAGFKYAVIDDREKGLIVTPSLRFEIPVGSDDIYQGRGDGVFIPHLSVGWGPEDIHLIAAIGSELPINGDKDTTSIFYNIHLNQAFENKLIRGSDFFVPFIELNVTHYVDSGDGSITLNTRIGRLTLNQTQNALQALGITKKRRFEAADVANLGSKGMANEEIVTMAWGFRVPFRNGISTGFSYERVLSQREDIFEQRATVMVSYTF